MCTRPCNLAEGRLKCWGMEQRKNSPASNAWLGVAKCAIGPFFRRLNVSGICAARVAEDANILTNLAMCATETFRAFRKLANFVRNAASFLSYASIGEELD